MMMCYTNTFASVLLEELNSRTFEIPPLHLPELPPAAVTEYPAICPSLIHLSIHLPALRLSSIHYLCVCA